MTGPEGSAPPQDGAVAMDIDALQAELATVRAALAAKEAETSAIPAVPKGALKQCESFTGQKKQKFADWITQFEAFQTAMGTPAESWGPALLTFVSGPASTHLRARFPTGLSQVPYAQLVQVLETAQLGRNETDYTLRDKLSSSRLKRGKSGRFNLAQHIHDWDGLLLQCKEPIDPTTACWMFLRTLPASLQSRVATDATGKSWTSLDALRAYVLAVADSWERESAHQPPLVLLLAFRTGIRRYALGSCPKHPGTPRSTMGSPALCRAGPPRSSMPSGRRGLASSAARSATRQHSAPLAPRVSLRD